MRVDRQGTAVIFARVCSLTQSAPALPCSVFPDTQFLVTTAPSTATAAAVHCPKCGHVRRAAETAPAWQCPACGIAYNKYAAYLGRVRETTRIPEQGDTAPAWNADGSVWMLLLVNAAILCIALFDHWNTVALMAAYWAQSVIIGVANVFRILALDRFSTEGFKIGGNPVDPTPAVKRQTAIFFAIHYGFFHFGYLVFLLSMGKGVVLFDAWFWLCTGVLVVNHFWSYRYNAELDRAGTPNIGTLMFTPYLRVIPMHLTIVIGALFINTAAGMIMFGVLKTFADLVMHVVEHAQLRKVRAP
jgi:Family of unknown function (DUF6498)